MDPLIGLIAILVFALLGMTVLAWTDPYGPIHTHKEQPWHSSKD